MANTSLNLVSLDFDTIKANLINYLSSQPTFQDYNFAGSNLNVLIDLLSYNTSLNAFYLNMIASEMFLDSAQLRSSVVSRAKELNYTPRSYKSSTAIVNAVFPQPNPPLSIFNIPAGTSFSGKNANGSYTFTTDNNIYLYPSNNQCQANLQIYEGSYATDSFVMNYGIEGQQFILSNMNVDTSTISVVSVENNGANNIQYQHASSLFNVSNTSPVFFVQAVSDTSWEIVFGDNAFGRTPLDGSTILATYRMTSGTDGNGCSNFSINTNLGPANGLSTAPNYTLTVLANSYNGSNAESIESIRYNAPRAYQVQERAITTRDYETLVLQNYADAAAAHAFGGETVSGSVDYGKVYVAVMSQSGVPFSGIEKLDIQTFLSDKCTIGITPIVIDPDYLYLEITSSATFDSNATTNSIVDIETSISNAIQTFNNANLIGFNKVFSLSRLEEAINGAESSISSNQTTTIMRKDIVPSLNTPTSINISYGNPIVAGSFSSTVFVSENRQYMYTDYNPNNNTFTLVQNSGGGVSVVNSTNTVYLQDVTNPSAQNYTAIGTIDYSMGTISLSQITITGLGDTQSPSIQFTATPAEQDISVNGNVVVQIDLSNLNISANPLSS